MQSNRDKNNKSSIDFQLFRQSQQDPQKNRIYVCQSVVGNYMMDEIKTKNKTETVFYQNRILNSTHKYQIPVNEESRVEKDQNRTFQQFFMTRNKFIKPYGENTKYIDLINKNQALLRRAQFDMPQHSTKPLKIERKNKTNKVQKYLRHTTKPIKQNQNKQFQESTPFKPSFFDKTMSTQYQIFNRLIKKQRSQKSQWIGLNNSMNRILAAESLSLFCKGQNRHHTVEV